MEQKCPYRPYQVYRETFSPCVPICPGCPNPPRLAVVDNQENCEMTRNQYFPSLIYSVSINQSIIAEIQMKMFEILVFYHHFISVADLQVRPHISL